MTGGVLFVFLRFLGLKFETVVLEEPVEMRVNAYVDRGRKEGREGRGGGYVGGTCVRVVCVGGYVRGGACLGVRACVRCACVYIII